MAKKPNPSKDGSGPLPTSPEVGVRSSSTEWIDEVTHTRENDLRAHRIALTYCIWRCTSTSWSTTISRSGATSLPLQADGRVRNANWFSFATWATLTVSQNIGNQQPLQRLNSGPDAVASGADARSSTSRRQGSAGRQGLAWVSWSSWRSVPLVEAAWSNISGRTAQAPALPSRPPRAPATRPRNL